MRKLPRRPGTLPFCLFCLSSFLVVSAFLSSTSLGLGSDTISPPSDEEVERWIEERKDSYISTGDAHGEERSFEVIETIEVHRLNYQIAEETVKELGTCDADWWLFVIFQDGKGTAGLTIGRWGWQGELPLSEPAFITYLAREVRDGYESPGSTLPDGSECMSLEQAISACKEIADDRIKQEGLEPGWPVVRLGNTGEQEGKIAPGGGEESGGEEGGSKIPGPSSWWQWLTGTVVAGAVAAVTGLLGTLFGGVPAPQPPLLMGPATSLWTPPEPPGPGIAADTVDPFDTRRYPDQPAYAGIGDGIPEFVDTYAGAAGKTFVDTGVALKDGVIGFGKSFGKGLISLPFTVLEGYVEIGRMIHTIYSDASSGRDSIFSDMIFTDAGVDTLKSLWSVGREFLPIDEVKSFFDPHASLEEQLWAIPSATVKVATLILMFPKLAAAPVPGLPSKTFIPSAKTASAVSAAKAKVDPEKQRRFEAYKAAAREKTAKMQKGRVTKNQVLDAMSDPATMRELKKASPAVKKEFSLTQTRKVYGKSYEELTGYVKGKYPKDPVRVGGVRTPGQGDIINTDNDLIVERLVRTKGGKSYWKEVPAREWEGFYYERFSRNSGFTLKKAKARFPEHDWDKMSRKQQHKAWAEGHGQEAMDVKNPEAAHAFSNQPTAMDPKWNPGGKSPVASGRMVDGEGLGHMEGYKTTRGWRQGNMRFMTESMEQGKKLGNLSQKLAGQSGKRTGMDIRQPEIFKQGREILGMDDLCPEIRDAALKELGFQGGYEEFMRKLSGWTGALP